MISALEAITCSTPLFRVGRSPDPWLLPDWVYAGADGTFGNRYDDPLGTYRVLYTCAQRLGAFVETLAPFRPDPAILATEIVENDPDGRDHEFPTRSSDSVPRSWCRNRRIGRAEFSSQGADLGHSRSLQYLRGIFANRVLHYGLGDLDAAAIRVATPRRFTQEISRHIYEMRTSGGDRAFGAIYYRSRYGDQFENWALLEPLELKSAVFGRVQASDPDLQAALKLLGLTLTAD